MDIFVVFPFILWFRACGTLFWCFCYLTKTFPDSSTELEINIRFHYSLYCQWYKIWFSVLVTYCVLALGQNTWHPQCKEGEISFDLQFQSLVVWHQGSELVAEGCSRGKLLTSWHLEAESEIKELETRESPYVVFLWLIQTHQRRHFSNS